MKMESVRAGRPLTLQRTEPLPSYETAQQQETVPQHDAMTLTAHGKQALITLNDLTYTLRITKQGKLLLTK